MAQPWKQTAWSPEQEQIIYRDWGIYFAQKQQLDRAAQYYDRSLDIKSNDFWTLVYRSWSKRLVAKTAEALKDSLTAKAINPNNSLINLDICDSLYELNQFEKCIIESHHQVNKYTGNKTNAFLQRIEVILENYKDCLGETLGPFILKNEKHFDAVLADIQRRFKSDDERPLWKILKERGKCDILSILEKEEILLSPREIARRFLASKVFNQIYLNRSWVDMLFLKLLHTNSDLLLEQSKENTPLLEELVVSSYKTLGKFLKMLNARSPLYNELLRKCPDKRKEKQARENNLYRVQYQTHRNMHTVLRDIKQMRRDGQIEKLSKYTESIMGDYVVTKTDCVMPWKIEFMYEVYNTLALAHTDRLTMPDNILKSENRMQVIFRMHIEKKDHVIPFKFGDRSTYQEPDCIDHSQIVFKRFLARLEKRLVFAKYSIEECYLLHEIARSYLERSHFDECCSVARKACEEAKKSKSHIWHFLSLMLICKSHIAFNKIERCKEVLEDALPIAKKLKSPELCNFVEICIGFNNEDIIAKKHNLSSESMRKRKSKQSIMSSTSRSNLSQRSSVDETTSIT